ncbi:MAG TPA: lytic transglycosylase domain-containing protein [archaeon]|nr:lytic transglycosylase domain-containing protein [archaeon]
MKGSGDAVFTLTIILFIMLMLSLLIFVVSSEQIKRNEIILTDKELLGTKDTFYLLNRSLAFTWYISSIQSVFRTMDDSIGCGIDDITDANAIDELPPLYWYRYEPTSTKSSKFSPRLPSQEKYNWVDPTPSQFNPKICYPQRFSEIETHALDYIKKQYDPYKRIPGSGLGGADNAIKITGGIKVSLKDIELDDVQFNTEGLSFEASENINVESLHTSIYDATEKHVTQVYTQFEEMLKMARKAVELLFIETSDKLVREQTEPLQGGKFDLSKRYLDIGVTEIGLEPAKNKDEYVQKFKDSMKAELDNIALGSDFSGYSLKFKKAELFASEPMGSTTFGAKCEQGVCINSQGLAIQACIRDTDCGDFSQLILHYDASIVYSEGSTATGTAMPIPDDVETLIRLEAENRQWKFGSLEYATNEIVPLVAAIIMQESAFDKDAVSACGAAGIMQFVPQTARDNGLNVPVYAFETCNIALCGMQVSACNSCTPEKCDKTTDERFKPGLSIDAGVNYIYTLFQQFSGKTNDKENLIKVVLAAYHDGPGKVTNIAAGNYDYESFKDKLSQEGQDYVVSVLGYYAQYGGSVANSEGLYYYHQDSTNKFYPRSFSMEQKAEDYLPAIDCKDSPYGEFDSNNPVTYNSIIRPHHWDSEDDTSVICFCGQLWSCNAAVQNLPSERSLVTGDKLTPPSEGCNQALIFIGASSIICTANGFGTT